MYQWHTQILLWCDIKGVTLPASASHRSVWLCVVDLSQRWCCTARRRRGEVTVLPRAHTGKPAVSHQHLSNLFRRPPSHQPKSYQNHQPTSHPPLALVLPAFRTHTAHAPLMWRPLHQRLACSGCQRRADAAQGAELSDPPANRGHHPQVGRGPTATLRFATDRTRCITPLHVRPPLTPTSPSLLTRLPCPPCLACPFCRVACTTSGSTRTTPSSTPSAPSCHPPTSRTS